MHSMRIRVDSGMGISFMLRRLMNILICPMQSPEPASSTFLVHLGSHQGSLECSYMVPSGELGMLMHGPIRRAWSAHTWSHQGSLECSCMVHNSMCSGCHGNTSSVGSHFISRFICFYLQCYAAWSLVGTEKLILPFHGIYFRQNSTMVHDVLQSISKL